MTIAYDVMLMQQLVTACQSANEELLKAQALVLEVQSHGDWTCKEKNTIDDLMRECKKRIQALCENEQGFLGAIRQVAEDLTDAEKNVSGLFGGVEGLLGKILAIPVKTVTVIGQGILDRLGWGKTDGNDVAHSTAEWAGHVMDNFRKQQVIRQYNPQFNDSGQLIWPEKKGAPPGELVEALGGTYGPALLMPNAPVTIYWPGENGTQVKQVFYPEKTFWEDLKTDENMIPRPSVLPDILDEIHIISCMDTKI